ncbi:MAG: triphosphoribosyl-dephospho-CoA synthase, partial [Planctomycetia bacterium]
MPWNTIPDRRAAVELACLLEAIARKPGNVHPRRDFADAGCLDFLAGGVVVGPLLADAATTGVGRAVYDAVDATRRLVSSNVNLGIALLLAPLCAADTDDVGPTSATTATVLHG